MAPESDLTSEQQNIVSLVADFLFVEHKRYVPGLMLRQRLEGSDREKKRSQLQGLAPKFLTQSGTSQDDFYSLMPLGALNCRQSDIVRDYALRLRQFIVKKFATDPNFEKFTWEELKVAVHPSEHELADDDFEPVSLVLMCLGAFGSSGCPGPGGNTCTWSRPLGPRLEDILEDITIDELFARVQNELLRQLEIAREWDGATNAAAQATVRRDVSKESLRGDGVFIVHGHDAGACAQVVRFVEQIGLCAIVLQEMPNQGKTIIEKFEVHSADVAYAIILLTPDDIGTAAANPNEWRGRARQNVVLELGYFIGKLGRERVCALRKGDIEIPSDIHGVMWLDLDPYDGWKLRLCKELRSAGYDIDANKA